MISVLNEFIHPAIVHAGIWGTGSALGHHFSNKHKLKHMTKKQKKEHYKQLLISLGAGAGAGAAGELYSKYHHSK
jgi:H+/Cl- antiporter ClcA